MRRYHCAAGGEWREGRKEGKGGKEKGDKEGTGEGICYKPKEEGEERTAEAEKKGWSGE